MEDNLSWPSRSNDCFGIWKHLLNHIWVKKALIRTQKRTNMVLYSMFSQPYSQYPVRARAYVRSRLFPCCNCYLSKATLDSRDSICRSYSYLCIQTNDIKSEIYLNFEHFSVCHAWWLCLQSEKKNTTRVRFQLSKLN